MAQPTGYQNRKRARKFTQAGALLGSQVKGAGGKRGFAETRLLTRWTEVCGEDIAKISCPVKVTYARSGFGATLILACEGARAAEVMMQVDRIRERVNACYGYNAIARVRLQQDDAAGFAERQRGFSGPETPSAQPAPVSDAVRKQAASEVGDVSNPDLAAALEALGTNIIARSTAPTSIKE